MKVAILTRHAIANYGSLLQAFATEEIFRDLNTTPVIVDYIRPDETPENTTKVLLSKSQRWNKNALTKAIYYIVQHPDHVIYGKKFRKFQKQWLSLTKRTYSSGEELKKSKLTADIFCTGSDQVWGNIGTDRYDPVYFLDFVSEPRKKISLAASLGYSELPDDLIQFYKKALDSYSEITVREQSAFSLFTGITNTTIHQVLDPTLLYERKRWEKKTERIKAKNYVLLYQLNANKEMDKYAAEFAKRAHKILIRVSPELHNFARPGKFCYLPSPGKFLSLIKNADYMITDSFHGTAFAINFNTQFIDVFPKEKSTRNRSILELTGLMDRVLTDYNDFSFIDNKIDFKRVNQLIDEERKKSLDIIKKMIE